MKTSTHSQPFQGCELALHSTYKGKTYIKGKVPSHSWVSRHSCSYYMAQRCQDDDTIHPPSAQSQASL
ncbi:hypothetical protein GDO78_010835 [Eleutherodactylus coqui]|uniref:Uncharacterized protein n=1 Tax=Eleutherodactylus coqui TaxID=57060 RepID=A0A8J6K7C0_ELECQ|nr:hypothetical protein GDO78_010835 [Eleutherodactylus coqui]